MKAILEMIGWKELKIYGTAFLMSSVTAMLHAPFHEGGHYVAGWLMGARDLQMDHFSVKTDEMEKFPIYKRVIFSLGGILASQLFIVSGFFFSKKQNLFVRLLSSSIIIIATRSPGSTIAYYLIILVTKKPPRFKADLDEVSLARKLGVSPVVIWLSESLFCSFYLERGWHLVPGGKLTKLAIYSSCFCGFVFGSIFYSKTIGPALLPDVDLKTK